MLCIRKTEFRQRKKRSELDRPGSRKAVWVARKEEALETRSRGI